MAPSDSRRAPRSASAKSPYGARLSKLRKSMKKSGCDALLITNPPDIRYLTPFCGDDSYALVPATGKPIIISDFRYSQDLEPAKPVARIFIRPGDILDAAVGLISDLKLKSVGVQSEYLNVNAYLRLFKALGQKRVKPTQGLVAALRVYKDDVEVGFIQRAIRIQKDAMLALRARLKPGMTELVIAATLEMEMKSRGAEGTSFPTIAAARANGSKPHTTPGAVTTKRDSPLLIDWGAKCEGYAGDLTRVFCFGRWPAEMRKIYGIVLEAQLAALGAIGPGKVCAEVDRVARSIIEKAGYGDQFGHGLGHGIGLNIHEDPRLSRTSKTVLEPGMVVTVEPGIYLPGVGGVRIEDDVLITARGAKVLSSLPKDLNWATL